MLSVHIISSAQALHKVERGGLVFKQGSRPDPAELVDHLNDVVDIFPWNSYEKGKNDMALALSNVFA